MGRRDVGSVFFLRNQTFQNSQSLKRNENHSINISCWNVVEIICMQTHLLFYYKYYTLKNEHCECHRCNCGIQEGANWDFSARTPTTSPYNQDLTNTFGIFYNEYYKYETTPLKGRYLPA